MRIVRSEDVRAKREDNPCAQGIVREGVRKQKRIQTFLRSWTVCKKAYEDSQERARGGHFIGNQLWPTLTVVLQELLDKINVREHHPPATVSLKAQLSECRTFLHASEEE